MQTNFKHCKQYVVHSSPQMSENMSDGCLFCFIPTSICVNESDSLGGGGKYQILLSVINDLVFINCS